MSEDSEKTLVLKIPSDVYDKLLEKSRKLGYREVSDYITALIDKDLGEPYSINERISRLENAINELRKEGVGKLESHLMRRVQDLVNPVAAEVSKIDLKLAELIEDIDKLRERVEALEKMSEERRAYRYGYEAREKARKTGIERLREEGVIFESEVKGLRDRDRFFAYLERSGAKVIEAKDERVAVDRDLWNSFREKLFEEVTTSSEEEVERQLSKVEVKLFKKLRESGLIYYDSIEKKWKPVAKSLSQ
ncbi:MAG: hypothetical protein QW224_03160 [Desulfurococcaceae archaeon]